MLNGAWAPMQVPGTRYPDQRVFSTCFLGAYVGDMLGPGWAYGLCWIYVTWVHVWLLLVQKQGGSFAGQHLKCWRKTTVFGRRVGAMLCRSAACVGSGVA